MGVGDLLPDAPIVPTDPQSLGVPPLPPAPAPPPMAMPQPQGPSQGSKVLQLLALGLLAARGRGASGLAAGLNAGHQQAQQDALRKQADTARIQNQQRDDYRAQQEDYQRQVQAQQMETQRRSSLLLQNLNTLKSGLMTAKDQGQADELLNFYGNALTQAGFRGYDANSLRAQGYRYYAPDVKSVLSTKLDKLFQTPNDLMKERAKSADVFNDLLTYTDPASKVQKTISVKDAIKLTDYPVTMGQDGQPFAIEQGKTKGTLTPNEAAGYAGEYQDQLARLISGGAVDNEDTRAKARELANVAVAKREKASRDITGIGQGSAAGGTAPSLAAADTSSIRPGSPAFITAQDLAYGKLTFPQMRTLLAYNRDSNAKLVLYAKARELNPDFDPARFEAGYKFAVNPQVRQRVVAIDALTTPNGVIDRIEELSNKVKRGDVQTFNALLRGARLQISNKRVASFQQLQTLLGDEAGLALGLGSGSDLKTKLGLSMVDTDLGDSAFQDTMEQLKDTLSQRKGLLLKPMGPYADLAGETAPATAAPPVKRYNPATGKVE